MPIYRDFAKLRMKLTPYLRREAMYSVKPTGLTYAADVLVGKSAFPLAAS